ncbi:ArsR/SmtB family transcription factor [Curtobacterium sp. S6]|uniref:ArsR/SmtB family transcription factor n=1 Tax=Curtobacterium sp. S6 TaxID=1479623 RepID=UPI0004AA56B8|nr:metalloregulator ArsR/SmtB family transcription factor [Curtobacterium sp. S6]
MIDDPVDLDSYQGVCHLFSALSSPARAATIHLLSEGEKTVGELVDSLDISQPLMSQHLRILRDSRLVNSRRAGRSIYYSLADDHVAHVFLDAWSHSRHEEASEAPQSALR